MSPARTPLPGSVRMRAASIACLAVICAPSASCSRCARSAASSARWRARVELRGLELRRVGHDARAAHVRKASGPVVEAACHHDLGAFERADVDARRHRQARAEVARVVLDEPRIAAPHDGAAHVNHARRAHRGSGFIEVAPAPGFDQRRQLRHVVDGGALGCGGWGGGCLGRRRSRGRRGSWRGRDRGALRARAVVERSGQLPAQIHRRFGPLCRQVATYGIGRTEFGQALVLLAHHRVHGRLRAFGGQRTRQRCFGSGNVLRLAPRLPIRSNLLGDIRRRCFRAVLDIGLRQSIDRDDPGQRFERGLVRALGGRIGGMTHARQRPDQRERRHDGAQGYESNNDVHTPNRKAASVRDGDRCRPLPPGRVGVIADRELPSLAIIQILLFILNAMRVPSRLMVMPPTGSGSVAILSACRRLASVT